MSTSTSLLLTSSRVSVLTTGAVVGSSRRLMPRCTTAAPELQGPAYEVRDTACLAALFIYRVGVSWYSNAYPPLVWVSRGKRLVILHADLIPSQRPVLLGVQGTKVRRTYYESLTPSSHGLMCDPAGWHQAEQSTFQRGITRPEEGDG
jgi:hypothetical protein